MKIIYCIHSLFNSGGMERIVVNKANYLARQGFSVYIITAEQNGRTCFYPLESSIRHYDLGINYSENSSFIKKLLAYPLKKRRHKAELTKLLFEIQPNVTISTMGNEAFFLYKIKDGSKKVLEIHFAKNYRLQQNRKGLWRIMDYYRSRQEEKLVLEYDRFVVLTQEDKIQWKNSTNIEVIPNFIKFNTGEKAQLNNRRLIAVGRFAYQKGFDRLIEAWKLVCAQVSDWKLCIYGDGELLEDIRQGIERYQLSRTVEIYRPTSQIAEAYLESSGLVLSSRYEGLPMVLLEAMSYGVPVVAFACKCGPRDIIEDGVDGILVKEGDVQALANGMMQFISQEELRKRLGRHASEKAKRFSEEVVMQKWMALLVGVCWEVSQVES